MNTRPGSYGGIAGIDLLVAIVAGLIGAVVGAILMCFWQIILSVLKLLTRALKYALSFRLHRVDTKAETSSNDQVTPIQSENPKKDLPAVFAEKNEKQLMDSFLRRIDLKGAYATIWFYPHQGIARRSVTITSKPLLKQFGKKINLSEMKVVLPHGISDVEKTTKEEVIGLLDTKKQTATKIPKENAVLPTGNAESNPDNVVEESKQPEAPASTHRPRRKEVAYRGSLIKHGLESRGEGDDAYKCYCLHIYDEGLGSTHQIWGTDIERAIKDARAKDGDRIEVAQVGTTPTASGNKKKVFSIQKLAQQRA